MVMSSTVAMFRWDSKTLIFLKFAITKKGQLEVKLLLLLSCNFILQRAEWVKNLFLIFIRLSRRTLVTQTTLG